MALTPEEITELKNQLRSQIQHLPPDKKAQAESQIDSLSSEALESMLEQQREQYAEQQSGKEPKKQKGIFRMIIDKEIPSKIIDENSTSLAVLDIKPISRGHIIIIPKKPCDNAKSLPTSAFTLAKKLAKRISSKLKAKSTEIQTENKFNEAIINIIPIYSEPLSIISQRTNPSEKELEEIYVRLKVIKSPKTKLIKEKKKELNQSSGSLILPRRIP